MQRIIGLDIGSYSIKAVEIVNTFKSYEIVNFFETPIPQINELPQDVIIPACLEQIFQENNLVADRIITAMPGQYISSRIYTFNFSEPQKITAAVYAEVEDAVPFDLNQMVIDHQMLGEVDGKSLTLVAMTRKSFLGSFLQNLQRINIDPKLIDVDSLAFYNLCPFLDMEKGKCYALIDIGHEKTSICLVQDNLLRMSRAVNLGGRYLTDFLSRDLEVSFNEAQRIKHKSGLIFSQKLSSKGLSEQEKFIGERLSSASHTLARELSRTFYSFKSWNKSPIEKIFLSGGSSLLKGLPEFLSEDLGVSVELSKLKFGDLQINEKLSHKLPIMSQSLSIGFRSVAAVKKHSQINLRKGDFAYVQDYSKLFLIMSSISKYMGIFFFLLAISYIFMANLYSRQTDKLRTQHRRLFLSSLSAKQKRKYRNPDLSLAKVQKNISEIYKGKISEKNSAIEEFLKTQKGGKALVALEKISQAIPPKVDMELVEYHYDALPDGRHRLRLRVEADSFASISNVQKSLRASEYIENIVEKSSDTKPGTTMKLAVLEVFFCSNKCQ